MMINTSLNMNIKTKIPDPKSQYRYRKQKRIPVFPQRLYDMLEQAEERGYSHIFSWMPDGKSFKIHLSGARCSASEKTIVKVLKSNNFQQTKFRSFLRQLNQYGFERTHRGKGEFRHEFFVRGKRHLLEGKSIDDFQQPHECNNENDEDGEENKQIKSFHQLLQLSSKDNTSLFLESDHCNYWKPSSANMIPTNGVHQETAWQMYAKSLVIPTTFTNLSRNDMAANEKFHEGAVVSLPPSLLNEDHHRSMPRNANEWNDDDTIPTIGSDDDFDDFMTSEFDMNLLREEMGNRFPCQVIS